MIIAMQQRVVMPRYLNDNGDLFGGDAMKWMDEVAYIAARKYTDQKLVTVTVDNPFFKTLESRRLHRDKSRSSGIAGC